MLAEEIQNFSEYRKCHANVRTADGHRQNISGITNLEFTFHNQEFMFEFLVIKSIKQDIICVMDFWDKFQISIHMVSEFGEVISQTNPN